MTPNLLEIVTGIVAALPGVMLSQWLGYRWGKRETEEKYKAKKHATEGGPYRTPAELTDPPMGLDPAKERDWRYQPQDTCPRCDEGGSIVHRGRFSGDHELQLESRIGRQTVKCEGHAAEPHIHYQCYDCGVDWAEIPPEEYNVDEDEE